MHKKAIVNRFTAQSCIFLQESAVSLFFYDTVLYHILFCMKYFIKIPYFCCVLANFVLFLVI